MRSGKRRRWPWWIGVALGTAIILAAYIFAQINPSWERTAYAAVAAVCGAAVVIECLHGAIDP